MTPAQAVAPNGAEYGTMMKCGHAANAMHGPADGPESGRHWCCVICSMSGGPDDLSCQVADPIDLTGRVARCAYYGTGGARLWECNFGQPRGICTCEQPSDPKGLPFFEHKPDGDVDRFYCGCRGWD